MTTATLQPARTWDVTLQRRCGHLVITPQATPPPGAGWRRPFLALADAIDAPMVIDLTHLVLDDVVVVAMGECLRGSAAAPWVAIKLVVAPGDAGRIRIILRPGGIGVYGFINAATTS